MEVASIDAKTLATAPAVLAPPDMEARDTIIAWYRGEFAAANAIIDVLCSHIVQITGGPPEYESVFAVIHRRRMNWIPILHMQRYYSIADVSNELSHVASIRKPLIPDAVSDDRADGAVAPFKTDVSGGADRTELEDMRSPGKEERPSGGILEGTQEEYSTADSSDGKMAGEGKSADGGSGDDEVSATCSQAVAGDLREWRLLKYTTRSLRGVRSGEWTSARLCSRRACNNWSLYGTRHSNLVKYAGRWVNGHAHAG